MPEHLSEEQRAGWWHSYSDVLDGRTPREMIDSDYEAVLAAARRAYEVPIG